MRWGLSALFGATAFSGYALAAPLTFDPIAVSGENADFISPGETFDTIYAGQINNAGDILLRINTNGTFGDGVADVRQSDGVRTKVVSVGDSLQSDASQKIQEIHASRIADDGSIIIGGWTRADGQDVTERSTSLLIKYDASGESVLFTDNSEAPDGNGYLQQADRMHLNDDGSFVVKYRRVQTQNGPSLGNEEHGLLFQDADGNQSLIRPNDPVPGIPDGTWYQPVAAVVNKNGQYAAVGSIVIAPPDSEEESFLALVRGSDEGVEIIARTTDPQDPDVPRQILSVGGAQLNERGDLVYYTTYGTDRFGAPLGVDVTPQQNISVLSDADNSTRTFLHFQDDYGETMYFDFSAGMVLNNLGTLVFSSIFSDATGDNEAYGLFYALEGGPAREILRVGELFEVAEGDFAEITSFGYALGSLNDSDDFLFTLYFADGRSALFLTDLSPVPLPAAAVLFGPALFGLRVLARRSSGRTSAAASTTKIAA